MKISKEKVKNVFLYIFVWVLIIGGCYLGILSDEKPKTKGHKQQIKEHRRENICFEIIYFNAQTHKKDTGYTSEVLYDRVVDYFKTPSGKTWSHKDFINAEKRNVGSYTTFDVTVSDGEHFLITPLPDCSIKSRMNKKKISNNLDDNDN